MPKARILIVEDEILIAETVKNKLTKLGYEVVGTVMAGEEAPEAAERHRPDLILMDIKLAGLVDGVDAAGAIQINMDVPIVFVTAFSDEATLDRVKRLSPYGYVIKPYQITDLSITIDLALSRHQADKRIRQQERQLHSALNYVGDGLIATDLSGNVAFLNGTAEQVTGVAHDSAFGKAFTESVRLQLENAAENPIQTALKKRENVRVVGIIRNKENEQLATAIVGNVMPTKDERGNITGTLFTFRPRQNENNDPRALNEIFELQDKARKEIASNLHEGIAQILSAAKMNLESVQTGEEQVPELENVKNLLSGAVDKVRKLSQTVMPSMLSDFGLPTALDALTRKMADENDAQIALSAQGMQERLPAGLEFNVFKIVQDLLTYVLTGLHADADEVEVNLMRDAKQLVLEVLHNGETDDKSPQEHLEKAKLAQEALTRIRVSGGVAAAQAIGGHRLRITVRLPI
jgi:PAS domain S-box-containing protein